MITNSRGVGRGRNRLVLVAVASLALTGLAGVWPAAAAPVEIDTIDVGILPVAVAITPDGTRAYVTNFVGRLVVPAVAAGPR